MRPFRDVGGMHTVRLSNSTQSRQQLVAKLKNAGCKPDITGTAGTTSATSRSERHFRERSELSGRELRLRRDDAVHVPLQEQAQLHVRVAVALDLPVAPVLRLARSAARAAFGSMPISRATSLTDSISGAFFSFFVTGTSCSHAKKVGPRSQGKASATQRCLRYRPASVP